MHELLSKSQIAALAEIGEKRSAAVGDPLYRVGDRPHSLMVELEGAVSKGRMAVQRAQGRGHARSSDRVRSGTLERLACRWPQ
jgi:hypothetical protein